MNLTRFGRAISPSDDLGTRDGVRNWASPLTFWAAALGTAAFWMLLIWFVHWDSPRTLVSFHGFLHAAIAEQFLDPASATFPPENPFFAGQPVAYYWFFQFVGAQLARLLEWNVFYSMKAIILIATGMLMWMAVALGRTIFRSVWAGVLTGYLVVAGTNPFGVIFAGLKVARDGTHILQDNPDYLWGVVHPVYSLIRYNDIGGLYGPLLNFFLNMTSRPVALASLMALVYCLQWSLRTGRPLAWALLALASALTTSFSPIIGITAGGALLASLAVFWLWTRYYSARVEGISPTVQSRAFVVSGIAIAIGILVASPTYYHLWMGPSDNQMQFWLFSIAGLKHLITVALSILPLVILAIGGMFRAARDQRSVLGTLALAALLLLAASVAFVLPSWNQSNFFHAAVVLLAIPAAGSIAPMRSRAELSSVSHRRIIGIVLFFLPTTLLLLAAYIHRPSIPLAFEGTKLVRLPQDSDIALLYDWAQQETGSEAIFVIDPGRPVAMNGNTAEFPAMARRAIFTEQFSHYIVSPYPDSRRRFDIATQLVSGETLSGPDQNYMVRLNRPIYVLSYRAESSTVDRMERLYGSPVFQQGDIFVFKWSR